MKNKNSIRLFGILIILTAMITAGYYTFIYFVKNITLGFGGYSLILVSIIAGVSMFFNPCSFTLLPAFLSFFASKTEFENESKLSKFLLYGLFASLGIITFSLILGSLIGLLGAGFGKSFALTGDSPNLFVRVFRGIIGVLLVVFGLMHIRGASFSAGILNKLSRGAVSPGKKGPLLGMYLYGFGYNALGIGCGGPIMAGLLVFSLGFGGFSSALFAFIVFSLTMVVLMLSISVFVGMSKDTLLNKMKSSTGKIKKFTGIILFLVGLFLLFSSIFTDTFVRILFPG